MAEAEAEPEPTYAPPPPVDCDVVFTGLKLTLGEGFELPPADEEGTLHSLELEAGGAVVALEPTADGASFVAKGRLALSSDPSLCLRLRVAGFTAPWFETAPLSELGAASDARVLAGRLAAVEMAAYAGEAEEGCPPAPEAPPSLACAWRLQKTLPTPNTAWQASHTKIEADSVAADPNHEQVWGRLRCPGLAARYTAPIHRDEVTRRLDTWVTEMEEVVHKPTKLHTGAWPYGAQPPYRPHHLLGDPMTRARRAEVVADNAAIKAALSSHTVTLKLQILKDELPGCTTAEQAHKALEQIKTFLETGDHLQQIDAQAMLKQLRNLRLAFERLVRNVWSEGPEVMYDRSKAALEKLLQRELARRKAAKLAPPPPAEPPATKTTLAQDIKELAVRHKKEGEYDLRLGLLSFKGKPNVKATKIW